MISPAYPVQYDGSVPMYAPGTPVAVAPAPPTYELIPHRVFVGGFPANTTEVELRQHFEQYFHIREAKVIRSTEGASKGYGFITFDTEEEADSVRNLTPEKLEFKGRRLNIGPALRRMNGHRFAEYAIATPTGVVPSPTLGYSYSFPAQTPYVMMGTPQPTAFVYSNTPTPQHQPFVFPPQPHAPSDAVTEPSAQSPSTPAKSPTASTASSAPMTPLAQPVYAHSPAYYVPVPGTPVPSMVNGIRSPSAVYSPTPFFVPQAHEHVQYGQMQTGYYYPQQPNFATASGLPYPNGGAGDSNGNAEMEQQAAYYNNSPAHQHGESGSKYMPSGWDETPRRTRNTVSRLSLRKKPQSIDSCGESMISSSSESPLTTQNERRARGSPDDRRRTNTNQPNKSQSGKSSYADSYTGGGGRHGSGTPKKPVMSLATHFKAMQISGTSSNLDRRLDASVETLNTTPPVTPKRRY